MQERACIEARHHAHARTSLKMHQRQRQPRGMDERHGTQIAIVPREAVRDDTTRYPGHTRAVRRQSAFGCARGARRKHEAEKIRRLDRRKCGVHRRRFGRHFDLYDKVYRATFQQREIFKRGMAIAVHEHRSRLGHADEASQLPRRKTRIERTEHGSSARRGEDDDDAVAAVRQQGRNDIALANPVASEACRHTIHAVVQLPIGECRGAVLQRNGIRRHARPVAADITNNGAGGPHLHLRTFHSAWANARQVRNQDFRRLRSRRR